MIASRALMAAVVILTTALTFPEPAVADSTRNQEWLLKALKTGQAIAITKGGGVTVAVIDTGVDASHVDLEGSVLPGYDLLDKKNDGTFDARGHGTGMAGLIAGHGHGDQGADGILGIAPDSKILPVRTTTSGIGTAGDLAAGIDWSILHGARVICLAMGQAASTYRLRKSIEDALQADIVIVAAVGNGPVLSNIEYPAAYPGVVAAAGTDEHGRHAAVSVTGPQVVLSAPATNIVSTYKDGGYGIGTGTSNSTAIIAGAAALVRAKFPHLSATEVIHRLTATAIDKGAPGRDDEYGYGIVNLVGALTAIVPPLSPSSGAPDRSTSPSISAAGPHHGTAPWLPFAIAGIALLATLAIWISLRRTRQAT